MPTPLLSFGGGGDEIPPDYGVPVFEIDLRSIPVEDGGSKPWLV
jgi:hypothetical protein